MTITQETVRPAAAVPAAGGGISSRLATICAVTAGFSAANIYYAQPLLTAIGSTFHVGSAAVSLVVTAGTVGFTLGMATLVPLGDLMDRRRLAVTLLSIVALFQLVAAGAPSLAVLIGAALVVATASVVSPLMVAFAATLSAPEDRGRVTGKVMSGVLIGILLARTAGGLLSSAAGWRSVYLVSAVLVLGLAVLLRRVLPIARGEAQISYPKLLASVPKLLVEEPTLRLRSAFGFVSLAGFNALWTSIAFLLAGAPYHYGTALIGLFGLVGAVGAIAARITGRAADRRLDRPATAGLLALVLISWGLMALHGGGWLWALVAGVVLLDFGVQGMQVMNLAIIYRLRPEVRSRLTTAYMTIYFLGGAAGSAASGTAYALWGWDGVCAVGAGLAGVALVISLVEAVIGRRTAVAD
ncbi:MFS transporter [Kitasatospora sp. NBC_01250]|uniref:MFS transporter n=1 Tax=Kitasatospora sp. NBC_01250 TaxID=2903571 RepID=UPI002E3341D5|nr:MFS transporter [Kitasatospora sp. NBC_01250]